MRIGSAYITASLALITTLLLFTTISHAGGYYFKKKNDVIHYTNVKPKENGYKKIDNPWGSLKGSYKNRSYLGSFTYSDKYDDYIYRMAKYYKLDPLLIKAIVKVESNFDPDAVSPKGAMGIMQLMPVTASNYGVSNAYDPHENIKGGTKYFYKLMKMFNNNITLSLAGYNAGENAVIKYGYSVPPYEETLAYVDSVYAHYSYLKKNKTGKKLEANKVQKTDEIIAKRAYYYEKEFPPDDNIHNNTNVLENKKDVKVIPKEKGFFSVQIASYPDLGMAQNMEMELRNKTYSAFIQKADLPGKGTWYRVKIGNFTTKQEAELFAKNIINIEPSINSTLVTLNN